VEHLTGRGAVHAAAHHRQEWLRPDRAGVAATGVGCAGDAAERSAAPKSAGASASIARPMPSAQKAISHQIRCDMVFVWPDGNATAQASISEWRESRQPPLLALLNIH
jgi:hypothetical protein